MSKAKVLGILIAAAFGAMFSYCIVIALSNWQSVIAINDPDWWHNWPEDQDAFRAGAYIAATSALIAVPSGMLSVLGIALAIRRI